jgi:hypothetical protein
MEDPPGAHSVGGLVCARTGMDDMKRRKQNNHSLNEAINREGAHVIMVHTYVLFRKKIKLQ